MKKKAKHIKSEDEATVKVAADLNDISVIFFFIKIKKLLTYTPGSGVAPGAGICVRVYWAVIHAT